MRRPATLGAAAAFVAVAGDRFEFGEGAGLGAGRPQARHGDGEQDQGGDAKGRPDELGVAAHREVIAKALQTDAPCPSLGGASYTWRWLTTTVTGLEC